MKILLVGKNLEDIRPLLPKFGFEEVEKDFELVIAHGGDGALLGAERDYPGVLKFPIRDARTAQLCPQHRYDLQLAAFQRGESVVTKLAKVAGTAHGKTLLGLNDVFLHSYELSSALRYRVRIDGELYANEIVGDGVGLSSVHGSTAYYRSITHSIFRVGMGLAFSNSTEEVNHLVLNSASQVEIEVVRGPGVLIADNSPERIVINEGEKVLFYESEFHAQIYALADFMCPKCRLLRHPSKLPFRDLRLL